MTTKNNPNIVDLSVNLGPLIAGVKSATSIIQQVGKVAMEVARQAAEGVKQAFDGLKMGIANVQAAIKLLDKALDRSFQYRVNAIFHPLAAQISNATAGIVDLTTALDTVRRGKELGLLDKDLLNISKFAAQQKLIKGNTVNLREMMHQLLRLVEAGEVGSDWEGATDILRYISQESYKNLQRNLSGKTKEQRLDLFRNMMAKELLRTSSQTGNILETNLARLRGGITALKTDAAGSFDILSAFAKTSMGVLAPFGMGVAGFLKSPITGIIGTGLGALASGVMLAVLGRSVKVVTAKKEGDNSISMMDGIQALFRNISLFLEAMLGGISGTLSIGDELGRISEKDREIMEGAGFSLKRIGGWMESAMEFGRGISAFSDAFIKALDFSGLKKNLAELFGGQVDFVQLGKTLGDFFGRTLNKLIQFIASINYKDTLKTAESAVHGLLVIFDVVKILINALAEIYKGTYYILKTIMPGFDLGLEVAKRTASAGYNYVSSAANERKLLYNSGIEPNGLSGPALTSQEQSRAAEVERARMLENQRVQNQTLKEMLNEMRTMNGNQKAARVEAR